MTLEIEVKGKDVFLNGKKYRWYNVWWNFWHNGDVSLMRKLMKTDDFKALLEENKVVGVAVEKRKKGFLWWR